MTTKTHRAVRVGSPEGVYTLAEVPTGEPGRDEVRITVEACGVCHSDLLITSGYLPGSSFPITAGHEIAGRIDALGENVAGWAVGDRVAVGWYGGSCGYCDPCRRGNGLFCADGAKIPGIAYPGGFADSVVVPAVALARIPGELTAAEAAPLACAGVTSYNALRHTGARAGDTVAILGIGGLGHLGVQFAAKMGFNTVAIARGTEKEPLARKLGAAHYIDSSAQDVAQALQALGGAQVILATATSAAAINAAIGGLAMNGELVIVGLDPEPMSISAFQLSGGRRIYTHASGTAVDTQDTMRFAALTGVRPWIEEVPLQDANAAVKKMTSNNARFRMVLTTGS